MLLQKSRLESVAKLYSKFFWLWQKPEELRNADTLKIEPFIEPLGFKALATLINMMATAWCERQTIPQNSYELQELPGIGPYSANATATTMSWDSGPCVDSVSVRVLRRFLGYENNTGTSDEAALKVYSQVSESQWRDMNWAILDLASDICMPRVPRCEMSPLVYECETARKLRHSLV